MRQIRDTLSAREYETWEHEKSIMQLQMEHQKEMKLLELEVQKLEVKWATWVRIPVVLVTLPVRALLIIPLSIYAARKHEVPEQLWKLLH